MNLNTEWFKGAWADDAVYAVLSTRQRQFPGWPLATYAAVPTFDLEQLHWITSAGCARMSGFEDGESTQE